MRKIDKRGEPTQLRQWVRDNAATPDNLVYQGGGFPIEAVRRALVEEQFYLCAYTMKRLPRSPFRADTAWSYGQSCHVEHFLPQSKYRDGKDIEYGNMLACFPPSRDQCHCEFGAQHKANLDPNQSPIVNPLRDSPDEHLRFRQTGEVEGITALGHNTIAVLNLNHPQLREERCRVINGSLRPRGKPISASQAEHLAQQLSTPQDGELSVHCAAIAQVLRQYAAKARARAMRINKEK
jgi:uncharacterized protein (TIGR02646 family)